MESKRRSKNKSKLYDETNENQKPEADVTSANQDDGCGSSEPSTAMADMALDESPIATSIADPGETHTINKESGDVQDLTCDTTGVATVGNDAKLNYVGSRTRSRGKRRAP